MRIPFLLFVLILISRLTVWADDQHLSQNSHIIAEAQSKQQMARNLALANAQITPNQQQFDVTYYELDLFPDVETQVLYGSVRMQARTLSENLNHVEVNFLDNMQVDSVFVNGTLAQATHANDLLSIPLDRTYAAGELFETRVVYHGLPAQTGFGAFDFGTLNGKPMVWTLSEPFEARNWWPCKDVPADKADSVDIKVTVRSDLIVASNGLLKEKIVQDDRTTYWWQERYPITTYLVSLAIYPYHTYSDWYVTPQNDSMEVQFYVFPQNVNRVRDNYAKTVPMLETLSELFGEYPFIKEKYGHAEFIWGGGGMEHQTITSLAGYSESLIVHELAHQWWGNMVTCETFHDIWLNEGFATYTEALWWEQQLGPEAMHQDMARNVYLGDETVYVENPQVDNIFYYRSTYMKAAWVLHMLRHVIGDEVFFELLHTYYDEFKFKTINTEQFRELCERVSGQELDQFFQQWIFEGGAPHYAFLWESQPSSTGEGYEVTLVIHQEQTSGTIFEMPVDIKLEYPNGSQTLVLQNNQASQLYTLTVSQEPQNVLFDPDNWILKSLDAITTPQIQITDYVFQDTTGAVQSTLNPGDVVDLRVSVKNLGRSSSQVSAVLSSDNEDIDFITSKAELGAVAFGDSVATPQAALRFKVGENAQSKIAEFELSFQYAEGSSQPNVLSIPVGSPTLLFVDDDLGASYERHYERMAAQVQVYADVWNVDELGAPLLDTMMGYQAVVWFTGDDRETTLTPAEQTLVSSYLEAGGHLLLTGQDIGYDLVEAGTSADQDFYTTVLHAQWMSEQSTSESVVGLPNDPVGNGLAMRFNDIYGGANNQTHKDVIEALPPAVGSFMYFPEQTTAGLHLYDPETAGKLVYLAFGMEGIAGPRETTASQLLFQILQWFDPVSAISDDLRSPLPESFVLEQNYPNPFNPATTLRFYAPLDSKVQVNVFNTLGQTIRTVYDGDVAAGWHHMQWDGTTQNGSPAASGVYFLQIRYKSENKLDTKSVKMLKLE